jgi:hypothetical protein
MNITVGKFGTKRTYFISRCRQCAPKRSSKYLHRAEGMTTQITELAVVERRTQINRMPHAAGEFACAGIRGGENWHLWKCVALVGAVQELQRVCAKAAPTAVATATELRVAAESESVRGASFEAVLEVLPRSRQNLGRVKEIELSQTQKARRRHDSSGQTAGA